MTTSQAQPVLPSLPRLLVGLAIAALAVVPVPSQGTPIGFVEKFALAGDRAAALKELIPGTEEDYYYRCLYLQESGQLDQVPALLQRWVERHGRSARVIEIENRQALLRFGQQPAATWAFLRRRLGLTFGDQRQVPGARPDLPTRLPPEVLAPEALGRRALAAHPNTVDGFRPSAFPFLAVADLSDTQLRSLLKRVQNPDLPNLPALVVRELERPRSRGFGAFPIHGRMLLSQLEECVRLRPQVIEDPSFVDAYLRRLVPSEDVAWRTDPAAEKAYLERLESFVQRLSPAHNSLRAHVLYQRLVFDLAQGAPDRERLIAYLRLPRPVSYVEPRRLREARGKGELVDLGKEYPTGFDKIHDDEPLVRAYLEHFLVDADGYEDFAPYVRRDYLQRLFAETKILAGRGDMERWYSLLDDPAYYERLRERVEIKFPPTQRRLFERGEKVALDVDVKNVESLLLKVFEIDTFNYYRETGTEVDASIDLDGLMPGNERRVSYDEGPLRRELRHFELPELDHPGVYVVELIGNGTSSRAVIRIGGLQYVERPGPEGQIFRVFDEHGQPRSEASIWFGDHLYKADDAGEIVLPYSTRPGDKKLVLRDGSLSALATFSHRAEQYRLACGIHLEREALLPRHKAKVLLRPSLLLGERRLDLGVLEEPRLTVTAQDQDGVDTTQVMRGIELKTGAETVHEVSVPPRLSTLTVTLEGKVQVPSRGEKITVRAPQRVFTLNTIDGTDATDCPLLGRDRDGYELDVLGKDGEPKADREVQLSLRMRDYTDAVHVTLKTDERGRIRLGELPGVESVQASGFPGQVGGWSLRPRACRVPVRLCGLAGDTLRVPYQGAAAVATPAAMSLLEVRGGAYVRDARQNLAVSGGFVELHGLAPGDYELTLHETGQVVSVQITGGRRDDRWLDGGARILPASGTEPLQVAGVTVDGGELRVQLANATPTTRLHVTRSRYLPAFDPFGDLLGPELALPEGIGVERPVSSYHSGRKISDEYRYILDRRLARKFPGNMLPRPGLLLNPWAIETWQTAVGLGGGAGGKFGGRRGAHRSPGRAGGPSSPGPVSDQPAVVPDLGFLPEPAELAANLRPDAKGVVTVPLAELGGGSLVHVLAVDRGATVYTTYALEDQPLQPRSRRLARSLDPAAAFAERRRIEFVDRGGSVELEDGVGARARVLGSLADVFELFRALNSSAGLEAFSFVLRWPQLSPDEKRAAYSEHACHELNFFLQQKDPEFFASVVKPYLENKLHKTFLDHWLLGDDLSGYLAPRAFGQLNAVERILLARRLQDPSILRLLREQLDLVPPNPQRRDRLFAAALHSGALSGGDLGLRDELQRQQNTRNEDKKGLRELEEKAKEPQAAARPRAPAEQAEGAPTGGGIALKKLRAAERLERDDMARRKDARRLYRAPETTKRYVEQNYWRLPIEQQVASLIEMDSFWRDFAAAPSDRPFASPHIGEAAGNLAEMILALAVLDLPFEAGEPRTEVEDGHVTLHAESPLLLVHKEIVPAEQATSAAPILVSQSFYRLNEPYRYVGNERRDAYVRDEFVVGVAYGCRVVVTNPTSAPRDLELLLQIPQGALPVRGGAETHGVNVRLDAYATKAIHYAFYFPQPGTMTHYPVQVTHAGERLAAAEPVTLSVVATPSKVDTGSWEHVSQNGSPAEVLAFLDGANLLRLDLGKIAWRMHDATQFSAVIDRLRQRHVYEPKLWRYALLHGDADAGREYLAQADAFVATCGSFLDSPLLHIDPVERRAYQHVEYEPLFNPRAHRFGKQREILNADLARQYHQLLDILTHRAALDSVDWMSVTYYLLLQDRVEEALASFARVDPAGLSTRLQYDYMRAYLDFFTDDHALARGIAERYRDYPVERWRNRFREVLAQLDQAEGKAVSVVDPHARVGDQTALAASEPSLELAVEARQVRLHYRNLKHCEVRYYPMDVEFLFSTHPFVQQASDSFAHVRPNQVDGRDLPSDRDELVIDIPAALRNANVLVEVRGGGLTRRQAYYANSLVVHFAESYGQLEVRRSDGDRPLPKVYVKVFSRDAAGHVRFHKDGYTDLRGRFDYASMSGAVPAAERYAILVLSERYGAVIREVEPPRQ